MTSRVDNLWTSRAGRYIDNVVHSIAKLMAMMMRMILIIGEDGDNALSLCDNNAEDNAKTVQSIVFGTGHVSSY